MEKLTNVVISKVFKGKAGIGQYGSWQVWSIYLTGGETKYDYFEKDNIKPFEGMAVASFEYEIEQKGQYTNYSVKKLIPVQSATPQGGPVLSKPALPLPGANLLSQTEEGKRLMMCTSYMKDVMVQKMQLDFNAYKETTLDEMAELIGRAGQQLQLILRNEDKKSARKSDTVPGSTNTPMGEDDLKPAVSVVSVVPAVPVVPVTDDVPF